MYIYSFTIGHYHLDVIGLACLHIMLTGITLLAITCSVILKLSLIICGSFYTCASNSFFYGGNMVLLIDDDHIQYYSMDAMRFIY